MVTPLSYGKGQISTLCKIKTTERIGIKFDTTDIQEISVLTKFGDNQISATSAEYVKHTIFGNFIFPNWPGGHNPNQFSHIMA